MNLHTLIVAGALLTLPTLATAKPPPHREGKRAEHRELLEKVREKHPEKFDHLMRLRDEDPKAFRHAMRRVRAHMGMDGDADDPQLRAEKEKMRGLREEMRDAIAAYRAAEGEDKDRARDEVSELAEEIFDAKQSHRQRRLERIRSHVDELEAEIKERAENREALIEEWIDDKLEEKPRGL